jgi:predicted phosphodiesterase
MSKTLILSDIHFGKPSSSLTSASQLKNLWSGCDELVLNGDTTEIHSAKHGKQSEDYTSELIDIASNDGVQTTLISGNHDPNCSETDWLWFWDETVFVFHGHAAFAGIAPWSWRAKYIKKRRNEYIHKSSDGFVEQLEAVRKASHDAATGAFSKHRPSLPHMLMLGFPAVFNVLHGWWKFPSYVSRWIDSYAPTAKYVITGHTHHAGIWKRNGRVIINTGCFGFPSHPRAVVIDDEKLTVYRLRLTGGNYSLGRVCSSWNAR